MAQPSERRPSLNHGVSFDRRISFDLPPTSPSPANVQPQTQPSVLAEEPIPRMKSIAPCIFVPLEIDITKPREPPRNRIEKLERLIAAMEAQRPGVLENLVHMAEHERLSIMQFGRQTEAMYGIPAGPGPSLPPEEVDWIMGNMSAPAPANRDDLNIKHEDDLLKLLERTAAAMPPPGGEVSLREMVAKDLADTVNQAALNMRGYGNEVAKRVHDYSQKLEKEKRVLAEAGKRPDQRHSTG